MSGTPTSPFQFSLAWLLVYLAAMASVSGGLAYGRWQALQTYDTAASRSEWTTWRSDVQKSQRSGGVRRRVPKSTEPPAVVLMRDYFGVCLALSLVLSTILFATFMIFIRGALASAPANSRRPNPDV